MQKVMQKAQELAEAILDSSIYQKMHEAELQVNKNEEAVKAVSDFIEKRQAVENLLADSNMDRDALAQAGKAMEEAEQLLNQVSLIKEMQDTRKEFTEMMNNVNRILRLVITGETEDEHECGCDCDSCSGSCSSCSGCH